MRSIIMFIFIFANITIANLGTEKGEKFQIELTQKGLEQEIESIEAFMRERALRNQLFGIEEIARLRERDKYKSFFQQGEEGTFNSPDDINRFSQDNIRGHSESKRINLSESKRKELLKLSTETNLTIGQAKVFQFAGKRNQLLRLGEDSSNLYEEILNLSVIDDDIKTKLEFDKEIKNSVIPFEKREIGVGLLSTNHLVKFKDFDAWATTFGGTDSKDIKHRGVRDIVLDRFANEASKVMEQNKKILMAAVIDTEKLEKEGRLIAGEKTELHMGKNKIEQDMRVLESFNNTFSLTQKQVAYEGAFYAKLSEHLSNLAKTDVEDAALFMDMFYKNNFPKDPSSLIYTAEDKEGQKKWKKWFDSLSDDEKKHYEEYLSLKESLGDNKLMREDKTLDSTDKLNFTDHFINSPEFKKAPFILKQYDDRDYKFPDIPELQDPVKKRRVNAMKFYYETVLRRIGLDFNYEIKEIPPGLNGEAKTAFIAAEKASLGNKGIVIDEGSQYIGVFKWETEKDPEEPSKERVRHLGDPNDSDKYLENYNSYLIFRLKEREKWAKIFHDIAEMMKKLAINIESLRQGGDHYVFTWDPTRQIFNTTLTQSSFKEFDGGVFKSINDYYTSLIEAYALSDRKLAPEAMKENLVMHEKLWKIEHYRAETKPKDPYQEAHEKAIKSRGREGRAPGGHLLDRKR